MRKQTFCICENKDADQLRGNREADQRLCFRYMDSAIPLLSKFQASSHLVWLCSPVCVGSGRKPERWFSHDVAHLANTCMNTCCIYVTISYFCLTGIDYTTSNKVQGMKTFHGWSLHDTKQQKANPYQQVFYLITLRFY